MKISISILVYVLMASHFAISQDLKTKNIIIVTLDGYRWQELFNGAQHDILFNEKYVTDHSTRDQFWAPSTSARREKLMPFFWNVIGKQGQLYGNREFKNKVNCSNLQLISYPGYSEMLVGFADLSVSSNKKIENPNETVLEFIHKHEPFKNQVAAFATWDAFPYILREEKSKIHINAGSDIAEGEISENEKLLNGRLTTEQNPYGARYDALTFQFAFEFLKRQKPRVMFIGFDETDEHAHGGRYDEYLKSAHRTDQMIGELWTWLQSQPEYKDQTTLLITTDHGRGKGKNTWRKHRLMTGGSGQIWFAVMGPDTPAFGEMKFSGRYYQKQVAKTIAAFLGLQYKHTSPVGEVVQTMMSLPLMPIGDSPTASEIRNEK